MINDHVLDLNQFKIVKTLGRGGCGEVFLIEKEKGSQFAAKIINDQNPHNLQNDQMKQKIQKEFYREIESFVKSKYPTVLSFKGHNIYGFKDKQQL